MRIRALGTFKVEGVPFRDLGSRTGRTLLKVLAMTAGHPVSVDRIADTLWGDERPVDWDRPGVVRATLKARELAALVAGARLAAATLAAQSDEQADELERGLKSFDRSLEHLRRSVA